MTVEENLRLIDEWVEAYNTRDFEGFARTFKESAPYHAPNFAEPLKGPEDIREHFEEHPTTFPDCHVKKERSFGQDDWVCLEFTWTATHKGPMLGPGGETIPPTNKAVRVPIAFLARFDEGKIAEAREYWDQASFMAQLGLSEE